MAPLATNRPAYILDPVAVLASTVYSFTDPFRDGTLARGTIYETQKCGSQEDGLAVQALRLFTQAEVTTATATIGANSRQLDAVGGDSCR